MRTSDRPYNSLNQYLQDRFGEKVYKLALRGGETCPNRDGTKGFQGCIFCGEGSGTFASESIDEAIEKLKGKRTGHQYIAYFQSFTSTYRMSQELIRRIREAAEDDRIVILSLATRPDCLEEEVLDFLTELRRKKTVWVELGLQTRHEKTADLIHRGYGLPVFEESLKKLRARDLEVIVHLILGLPGESREDMLESIQYLNEKDIQGVKLQLLHVLRNTPLGEMFLAGKLWNDYGQRPCDAETYPFTLEEYAELVQTCIRHLRPDIVIHRMTGDAPKKDLLAPLWSSDKKRVLQTLYQALQEISRI